MTTEQEKTSPSRRGLKIAGAALGLALLVGLGWWGHYNSPGAAAARQLAETDRVSARFEFSSYGVLMARLGTYWPSSESVQFGPPDGNCLNKQVMIGQGFGGVSLERVKEFKALLWKRTPEAEREALDMLRRGVIWSVYPGGSSQVLEFDDPDAPGYVKVMDSQGLEIWVPLWAVRRG